ncbi:MAG: preprotein translocase subunit Sec61beta [Thermoplasmatota archaeon]
MPKDQGAGFQQAAGLIRYFDSEEESAIHIDPRVVLIFTFVMAIGIAALNTFYNASS